MGKIQSNNQKQDGFPFNIEWGIPPNERGDKV